MEAENYDIDTEKFVLEMELRPLLWDLNDEVYCNRNLKRKNWVVLLFKERSLNYKEE